MTVIESKLKLIKVAIKMLHGDLMVRANDRALEETPKYAVSFSVSDGVLLES